MKAISLHPHYAAAVAIGAKRNETRSWPVNYRGPVAIHATAKLTMDMLRLCRNWPFNAYFHNARQIPTSAIVAVADVVQCEQSEQVKAAFRMHHAGDIEEEAFGEYAPGRWIWKLENVIALPVPVPCRGLQGLWTLPAISEVAVQNQLTHAKTEISLPHWATLARRDSAVTVPPR